MEWFSTSIFSSEALFAYVVFGLRLAEIYVPFVTSTKASAGPCGAAAPAVSSPQGVTI
jgi:hypothetical protein